MSHIRKSTLATLLLTGVFTSSALAEQEERPFQDHKGIYTFSVENDIVTGQDNNYTNGFRFSYISPEGDVPYWLDRSGALVPFFAQDGHKRWSLQFGQSIYTPENIETTAPQPNEQPYAGWLYGTAGLTSDTGKILDRFELTLGIVGPASMAEHVQETVHDFLGSPHPMGWQYQLENEPGIVLSYERQWRAFQASGPGGWGVDFTPRAGASLGNIFTDGSVGAIARLGQDLPADYGPPLIRSSMSGSDFFIPTEELGWYLFAGAEGRGVARNIFLDGNTFEDSPSVDKKHWVGGLQAGLAVVYRDMRVSYTHVLLTDEYEGQTGNNQYGAVSLSMRF